MEPKDYTSPQNVLMGGGADNSKLAGILYEAFLRIERLEKESLHTKSTAFGVTDAS